MYIFKIFKYKPSIYLILLFGVFWAVLMVFNFLIFLTYFPEISFSVSLISFGVFSLFLNSFLSIFKFRFCGKIEICNEGVSISVNRKNIIKWNQIDRIKIRIVNHVLIKFLDRLGGFLRYNHLGYNSISESFFDKIEINGDEYYVYIRKRVELVRFRESIDFIKSNITIEVEEVEFEIKNLV
jgi:hypothetical protein